MGLSPDDIQSISEANTGFRMVSVTLWKATAVDCTACDFDPLTSASVVLNCSTCNGLGKTITYARQTCMVRPDYNRIEWGQSDSGEVRFVTVKMNVASGDKALFKSVRDNEFSFLVLDSYELKPSAMWPTLVADEWIVICESVNTERWLRQRNDV